MIIIIKDPMTLKNNIFSKAIKLISSIFLLFVLTSCSGFGSKEETGGIAKKRMEPNIKEATRKSVDSGGITLFGNKKNDELGQNNSMWKATLEVLDFIPLANATFSGGVIITDWYTSEENSNKSIKINVKFTSPELAVNSIDVDAFEKKCVANNCQITKLSKEFSSKIKVKIIEKARELEIKKSNKK